MVSLPEISVETYTNDKTFTNLNGFFNLLTDSNQGTIKASYVSHFLKVLDNSRRSHWIEDCSLDRNGLRVCFNKTEVTQEYDIGVADTYNLTFKTSIIKDIASADAYWHSYHAQKWAEVNPSFHPERVLAEVNSEFICNNAFYFPGSNTMLFGAEEGREGGCTNTAYSTVIRHEYGHAIIDFLIGNTSRNSFTDFVGYHEGSADVVSSLSLNEECLGEDLVGRNTGCVRNVDDDWVYPVNSYSPHNRGRLLSGSFWDLKKALELTNGEELGMEIVNNIAMEFFATNFEGLTQNLTYYVVKADEKYYNGNNIELINDAFSAHGFDVFP